MCGNPDYAGRVSLPTSSYEIPNLPKAHSTDGRLAIRVLEGLILRPPLLITPGLLIWARTYCVPSGAARLLT